MTNRLHPKNHAECCLLDLFDQRAYRKGLFIGSPRPAGRWTSQAAWSPN